LLLRVRLLLCGIRLLARRVLLLARRVLLLRVLTRLRGRRLLLVLAATPDRANDGHAGRG
jgi:hypothetical protein